MQSRNERMFLLTFLVLNTADNPRQLGNNIFQAGSIAQKYNCQLTRLDFQQEEGLMSCLPLGLNQIEIQRGLTTSSTAIFVPFTTQELFQNGKEALYYGINALSNNLIMVDMRYLSVMSRFHRYSVNNTMLIYMQKPDATLVAGYNKWKDQFERHVKKGEHGITIIAPTPYKKKIEEQKLDPDTKAPILDKDGKIVTEEKEIEIPMFRPVKVFDVSQTDGKPLPELASSAENGGRTGC